MNPFIFDIIIVYPTMVNVMKQYRELKVLILVDS